MNLDSGKLLASSEEIEGAKSSEVIPVKSIKEVEPKAQGLSCLANSNNYHDRTQIIHSTPKAIRLTTQGKRACDKSFYAPARKTRRQETYTKSTRSVSVQTDSVCDCDFYDENGLEMMCSVLDKPHFFQNLAEIMKDQLERAKEDSKKLEHERDKYVKEVNGMETTLEVLRVLQSDAPTMESKKCHDLPNDSGVADLSRTEDSICKNASVEPLNYAASLSNKKATYEKQSTTWKPAAKNMSRYVQASTCCLCDITLDEVEGKNAYGDTTELEYMYDCNKSRMEMLATKECSEIYEWQVSEEKEKLIKLEEERTKWMENAKNAKLLADISANNYKFDKSSFDDHGCEGDELTSAEEEASLLHSNTETSFDDEEYRLLEPAVSSDCEKEESSSHDSS